MPTLNYQLDLESSCRDYGHDVSALVDEVIRAAGNWRGLIDEYRQFVVGTKGHVEQSNAELLVEFIMLGVLWRARGHEATTLSPAQSNLVTELVRERRNLLPKRRDTTQNGLLSLSASQPAGILNPSIADLRLLLDWLLASGEYDDEVKPLERWLGFLLQYPGDTDQALRCVVALALDFENRAEARLGPYTSHVNHFLRSELPHRLDREDAVQCSRRQLEYHFNMFGAELLNRAWRAEFVACDEHVVVLSGCLRQRANANCKATRSATSLQCTHCNEHCNVSKATKLARRYGKTAVAVIHGSDYTRFLRVAQERGTRVGIIGVACAPGIVGAGLRAQTLGIPAQCVVLNSSTCAHWREHETPNSFSLAELERIVGEQGAALASEPCD